jgi:phage recombination protein Bet
MFIQNCKRYGLDPFTGQIHAVKRWDKSVGREVLNVQVGIDGFRLIADRTGKWNGTLGPYWCGEDGEWTDVWLSSDYPAAAKVGVLRSDFTEPRWGIARWDAYVATKKGGDPNYMWRKMSAHMLAKCAEALALRSAFPNDLSGLYTDAEMDQAGNNDKRTYDGPDPDQVQDVEAEVVDNGQDGKPDQWYEQATDWLVKQVKRDAEASAVLANADNVPSKHPIDDWPEDMAETAISRIKQAAADRGDAAAEEAAAKNDDPDAPAPADDADADAAGLEACMDRNFSDAYADGKEDWDAISEAQLNRLYAIAEDYDWDEAALNRLVKDELGWESKADLSYGDPYDEVCAALEDERLRYHMSRDPDTPDMFDGEDDSQDANHEAFEEGTDDKELPF